MFSPDSNPRLVTCSELAHSPATQGVQDVFTNFSRLYILSWEPLGLQKWPYSSPDFEVYGRHLQMLNRTINH
jgi:hypothetical protein